jgi:3-oxoacyl-[acyl-carrier protein] reductase
VHDVNVLGALRAAKALLPHFMKQRDGVLLFVSSIAAVRGVVGAAAYSASKAALNSLAKSISKEYGRFNVRAYTVMPGYVNGGMLKDMDPKRVEEASKGISLRRFAEVDEVARFIISTLDVDYLTGTAISMDGGLDG